MFYSQSRQPDIFERLPLVKNDFVTKTLNKPWWLDKKLTGQGRLAA